MTLAQESTGDVEDLGDLDASVLDQLPADIRSKIEAGSLEELPASVVEQLPARVQARIPDDLVAAAGASPGLTAVLVIAGVLGVLGFVYGVAKSAFKAAAFFGLVAAVAWYWFANR